MLNVIAAAGLVASLLVPASTSAIYLPEDVAAPAGVGVELASVNGSGCPNSTGSAALSRDGKTVTISTDPYLAMAGADAKPTDFRKNCQIVLRVKKPANYTYAPRQADAEGFGYLAKGANGTVRTNYYFQGASPEATEAHSFQGPMTDEWQVTDVLDSLIYAPCGQERYLNINTELRVNRGSSAASETNLLWRGPTTKLVLTWKRCAA